MQPDQTIRPDQSNNQTNGPAPPGPNLTPAQAPQTENISQGIQSTPQNNIPKVDNSVNSMANPGINKVRS